MPVWTKEQHAAIYDRNQATLVSAAAGSGKTAVLIHRIFSLLKEDQMELDRMLVVTFTRAAAAEMRERLSELLYLKGESSSHLRKQLEKLDQANISTLHVFCSQVIKEYFHIISLDPTSRIVEGGERDSLLNKALSETLEKAYEEGTEAFLALAHRYTDKTIGEFIQQLYQFLMSQPAPWEWLEEKLSNFPNSLDTLIKHPWFSSYCNDLHLQIQGPLALAKEMVDFCNLPSTYPPCIPVAEKDLELTFLLSEDLFSHSQDLWEKDYTQGRMTLPQTKKDTPEEQVAWQKAFKEKREQWRKLFADVINNLLQDSSFILENISATHLPLQGLAQVTFQFYQYFQVLKKEKKVFDFHDLEHYTLAIMQHKQVREQLQSRYDAIFVDEYQDTSGIQEAILNSLFQKNQLFMVGDVKQSIYRFRLADPTLFLEKHKTFSKEEKASMRKIDLQKNFRSSPKVLEGINQVFTHVMNDQVTEIQYDEDALLLPGLPSTVTGETTLYINLSSVKNSNKSEFIEAEEEEASLSKIEQEATLVADYFIELYGQTLSLGEKSHILSWKDMVVLLPKARNVAKKVAEILQAKGIPVYSDADEEYFSLPEVSQIMAFLHIIDNPLQDLPLLQMLKSPPFFFTEEELSAIRIHLPDKEAFFHQAFFSLANSSSATPLKARCEEVVQRLSQWERQAYYLPLDQFLWQLLMDTDIYTLAGAMPGGEVRQANLRLLCQRSYNFSQLHQGKLHEFLLLGETLSLSGDSQTAKILGEGEDVVRLMTIHKSKGLEFPVVAVMELGSLLHGRRQTGDLFLHKDLGLALSHINYQKRYKVKTLGQRAIYLRSQLEEKAEKARILYVAMTRAKNYLLLVGSLTYLSSMKRWSLPEGTYSVFEGKSMLDWVCQSLYYTPQGLPLQTLLPQEENFSTSYTHASNPWKIKIIENISPPLVEKKQNYQQLLHHLLSLGNQSFPLSDFSFYTAVDKLSPPLKTSVSSLTQKSFYPNQYVALQEETSLTKASGESLIAPLKLSPLPSSPKYMDNHLAFTSAQKGTFTHRALSLLNLKELKNLQDDHLFEVIDGQLNTLTQKGVFTPEEKKAIHLPWLCGFFTSSLGKRLLNSSTVYREYPFVYQLPGGETLVQGVIDCCFIENNQFVLLDYKTDYVESLTTVTQRYQGQISLYRQALEAITKKTVKESYIYLLRTGEHLLF